MQEGLWQSLTQVSGISQVISGRVNLGRLLPFGAAPAFGGDAGLQVGDDLTEELCRSDYRSDCLFPAAVEC
jgi:hypothetical protein